MSKQVLFLFVVAFVYVQGAYGTGNTWTRKNDVGYPVKDFIEPATRSQAVAFSIGSKGYVGGGNIGLGQALQDFWAYDSLTGGWTQLASIPNNLANAVGFAVGTKGYVGTGYDSLGHVTKLFYQYDPAANTWARKADYAGGKRHDAVGFSLAGYGYIATGDSSIDNSGLCSDMWRYDTLADAWTQQAGFLGGARAGSVAFTIGGNAAYVGTGEVSGGFLRDFYEYNSNTSAWTVRASLPTGAQRTEAIGFSIGGTGYVCTGNNPNLTHPILDDFYEYNPTANTWAIGPVYGGHGRISGIAFSIGSRAYVGTGLNPSDVETGDMRCFDQNTGKWRGATPFGGVSNSTQSAFTIDSNAYAGGGGYCDLRKYSPGSDSWASAAFVIDTLRTGGVAFNIGNYGYTGMGVISGSYRSDFWQYNPTTDSWSQKASFPGGGRTGAAAFGIDTMGYVGMGTPSQLGANPYYDFWMYNPYVNTWALRDSFAGGPRQDMSTFVIGNGGYVTLGQDANNSHTDTWEYDAITGHWIARDSFPVFRNGAYSFSAGSKGYVGLGYAFSSFYEYDMVNNIWNQVANFPYISRSYGISFSVNGIGYIGLGSTGSNTDSTVLWQYEPNPSILSGNASDTTFCVGQTVTIPFYLGGVYANNNVFSLEISDSTGNFANGVTIGTLTSTRSGVITGVIPGNTHPANGYLIRVVSSNPAVTGTTVPGSFTIHTSVLPAITITPSANNVCSGTLISFTSSIQNGGATPTYQWTVNTVTKSTTNAYSSSTLNNNDTVKCVLTSSYFCAVPSTVYDTVIMKINTIPSSPVAVLGNDTLCVASPGTFSVAPVSGATSYIWQIPSGWSGTSTTDSITVTPNNSNGTILVWASNSCGISAQASESVYAARSPGPPQGNIAGSATVCAGGPQVYILPAVSGASSYIWTLPNGWTGSSLTDTISTVVGASSGNILVTASNVCGTGPPAIFAVSVTTAVPGQPGAIFGLANACSGTTQEYRSVQVFNATSYTCNSGFHFHSYRLNRRYSSGNCQ
jgi:N-acetylneuraminic acid mutarotase